LRCPHNARHCSSAANQAKNLALHSLFIAPAFSFGKYAPQIISQVELLPVAEFSGNLSWGYGDTHHFVIESSAGGISTSISCGNATGVVWP